MLAAYRRLALARLDNSNTSPAHRIVFEGLEGSTDFGMGRGAQSEGPKVAGKTGTAAAREGPWTHGWFLGYSPADKPEIVMVVFLERGRGPVEAAEVAHKVFEAYAAERRSK
jgi:cell division protein FtsI/penicillin-binding protein 2